MLYFKLKKYILSAISVFLAAVAFWFGVKKIGKQQEEIRQYGDKLKRVEDEAAIEISRKQAEAKKETEVVKNANEILQSNSAISASDAEHKLRDKWQRD